ncbi:LysR family transcriptional regulator [Lysobacter terrae]
MNQDVFTAGTSIRGDALVDVSGMATFVAVISESSFTIAARRIGVSKSVISRRISDMEAQLGVSLIDRNALRVRPTEVGAVYYAKCVRILESIESANDFVTGFHGGIRGSIRTLVPKCFNLLVTSPMFSEFASLYPELKVEVRADDTVGNLHDSGFDLALRIGSLLDAGMVAKTVGHCRYWLVASAGYLKERGTPQSVDALESHSCLLHANVGGDGWQFSADGEDCLVRVNERMRSDCNFQLLDAARAGLGLAMLPDYMLDEPVSSGSLMIVMPQFVAKPSPISVVYPPSRRGSPKLQAIVNFFSEKLAGLPSLERFAVKYVPQQG